LPAGRRPWYRRLQPAGRTPPASTCSLWLTGLSRQAKATIKDGVLEVVLPKSERSKAATPKKIQIE
jgi:adenylylsulfate kinase-like enzyme